MTEGPSDAASLVAQEFVYTYVGREKRYGPADNIICWTYPIAGSSLTFPTSCAARDMSGSID